MWRQGVNAKQITCPLSVYLREGGVGPRLLQKCELLAKQFSTWGNDAKHRLGLVLSLGSLAESDVGQPVAWRFRPRGVRICTVEITALYVRLARRRSGLLMVAEERSAHCCSWHYWSFFMVLNAVQKAVLEVTCDVVPTSVSTSDLYFYLGYF